LGAGEMDLQHYSWVIWPFHLAAHQAKSQ
jgi:hypothetical protein